MIQYLIFEIASGRGVQMSMAPDKARALAGFSAEYGAIEAAVGVSDATHGVDPISGSLIELPPTEPSQADLAAAARARRDALLQACDWTQGNDSPLGADARAAWAAYRSALRGVPEQEGFPRAIDWPGAPA